MNEVNPSIPRYVTHKMHRMIFLELKRNLIKYNIATEIPFSIEQVLTKLLIK